MGQERYQIVIVGAGLSGLTAAAYLSKHGYSVLVIDKTAACGGLLNSFEREGFTFDAGARSIENAGIVKPMLKDLGIELELLDSPVSIGFGSEILSIQEEEDLNDYIQLLTKIFPDEDKNIQKIYKKIKKVVKSMDVIYGFDNPIFKEDFTKDKKYLLQEILPWFGKFIFAVMHMNRRTESIETYLRRFTSDQALIDLIDQHFFKMTPSFFALGYFYVYRDYLYPKGGTGKLAQSLTEKIKAQGAQILTETEIVSIDPKKNMILDDQHNEFHYDQLIWGADLKTFYSLVDPKGIEDDQQVSFDDHKDWVNASRGGDSIFSLYLGVDLPVEYFSRISNGHFFYTPLKDGLGETHKSKLTYLLAHFSEISKEDIYEWTKTYCELNTYEISIPSLRDSDLSPEGKTGLIASVLFEYDLVAKVDTAGWYDEFKHTVENQMISVLSDSIYPRLDQHIQFQFSSTPLSIKNIFGCSEGGITGWTYERPVPVIDKLPKIPRAVKTPFSNIYQVGQWAYSPAGIPTAILTGWYAADQIRKIK